MSSNIKNIIMVVILIAILVFGYIFFFKNKSDNQPNLTSSFVSGLIPNSDSKSTLNEDTEFITVLLGIKNIKLNDSIFSNIAFTNLRDSSIILVQEEGSQGRLNPFAPIGF
jgi:hypothetical protein